jgi:hypothetical protein
MTRTNHAARHTITALALATALTLLATPAPMRAQIATFTTNAQSIAPGSNPIPFGGIAVQTADTPQTIILTNADQANNLTVSGVSATGGNSADFTVTTNPGSTCGTTLAPLATCTITVVFKPSAMGTRASTLTITDNASNSPQTFILSGVGSALPGGTDAHTAWVSSTYTNATTSPTNISGLSHAINAFQSLTATCAIQWQASANTAGPDYQITGPSGPTAVSLTVNGSVTASTSNRAAANALATPVTNAGTVSTGTDMPDLITIGVINGATAGTIQLKANADGTGTLTIEAGSHCNWQ